MIANSFLFVKVTLGYQLNPEMVDQQVSKIKKQFNMMPLCSSATGEPLLIDDNITTSQSSLLTIELDQANEAAKSEIITRVEELELSVKTELKALPGAFPDSVSLLTKVA